MPYQNPVPVLPNDPLISKKRQSQNTLEVYTSHNEVFFAFIDVLGFRQTFDDHREDNGKEFATDYGNVFSYYSFLLQQARFMDTECTCAGQTSDSLYFYTKRPDHLAEFIKIYLHFSYYAMSKNIFFRGGIAKGCLYVAKEYQFYGDSVIKAYLLEEQIAKYPRVALDEETYLVLKDIPELNGGMASDTAGRYYLYPFFSVSMNDVAAIANRETSQLKSIKKQDVIRHITKGKKRFEFDDRNYSKYIFLLQEIEKLKGQD